MRGILDAGHTKTVASVIRMTADPERPWAEWKRGKPLTQKQLAGLLRPFGIISETVSIPGLADAKGYKRVRFEEAWEAYLPGQNRVHHQFQPSEASKRRNADGMGTSSVFSSVAEETLSSARCSSISRCAARQAYSPFIRQTEVIDAQLRQRA